MILDLESFRKKKEAEQIRKTASPSQSINTHEYIVWMNMIPQATFVTVNENGMEPLTPDPPPRPIAA